jgi:hypothetical protein
MIGFASPFSAKITSSARTLVNPMEDNPDQNNNSSQESTLKH